MVLVISTYNQNLNTTFRKKKKRNEKVNSHLFKYFPQNT